jgi:cytochrome c biogenesis protein CcmG, thiol:disulfide interchange protein DsbE
VPTSSPNTPSPNTPSSKRNLILVVSVLGIAALALVAVLVSQKDEKKVATASTVEMGTVAVDGAALETLPESGADPAVGAVAPTITGQGFNGSPVSVTPGEGPMVVMFVAHWCPHCQREVPQVASWVKAGRADGVALRTVATGTDAKLPNYPPSAWLEREGWSIPTLADDATTSAATAYGLTAFPYFVALNGAGKVTARASGELTEAQFTALLATTKS